MNCGESAAVPHPAPGPIAGVGLPALAIGYGAFWMFKRLRKSVE